MGRIFSQLIDQLAAVFNGMSARVFSRNYVGGGLDEAVYYEVQYRSAETEQEVEMVLAVEQRLIFTVCSGMLERPVNTLDTITLSAERFQESINYRMPKFSDLFDTEYGRIALCINGGIL